MDFLFSPFSCVCQYVLPSVLYFSFACRPSVFPRTFGISHPSLLDIFLLRFSVQCKNQLKWKYSPQYYFHYRFNRGSCYFSCVLPKTEKDFLKYRISVGQTMGSYRYVLNSLFYFWWTVSLLPPTRYAVGSVPTPLCGFRHALVTMSGRHGADGSSIAIFLFFSFCLVKRMWHSSFPF